MFENIIGYNHIKNELIRIIDCINNKDKYNKLGVNIPKGLLLYGEPGLGKTLFAKSFIESLNRNKYIIRKDKPDGEFVNSINEIINEAINNAPSVVLLDDLDKFSNNDDRHKNTDEFVVVQSFIDDAKDKDVYFVATANDIDDMPDSLLRKGRFDYKIEFNYPTLKDSKLIIEHYLTNKKIDKDIDYEEIANLLGESSCAVLESVMNEAGLIAGFNNHNLISREDIIKAILRIIYDSPENDNTKTKYQLKLATYHEAGHTLVSEILEPGSVNLVSIANYFGNKGGITSTNRNDDYFSSLKLMENRIKVLLAGKAASEIYLNEIDLGVGSDLQRAQRIIDRIIEEYAINNFKYWGVKNHIRSNNMYETFEKDSLSLFERYYADTKTILFNNKDKYLKIVKLLEDKEIITQREIKTVMEAI